MAYNLSNMIRIAQVGAMNKPQFRNLPTLDFSGAIDNYYNAKDAATRRAQEEQQQRDLGAWSEAINNGDTETANRLYAKINPEGFMQRQQQLEDMARKEQFQRNLAAIKHGYAMQTAAARAASKMADIGTDTEKESYDLAQNAINQLYDVAKGNKIGVFTDWLRNHGLTGQGTEQEYGRISSAVAGIAPRAIAKLKAAGVSGINSLPEFMTYIGLPQNPTSQQIMGAIPLMAQIAGVENPLKENTPSQSRGGRWQEAMNYESNKNKNSGTLSNGITWRVK